MNVRQIRYLYWFVGVLWAASFGLAVGCGGNFLPLPDDADSAVDTSGYTIEMLPVLLSASYVRNNDVYLGCDNGKLYKVDETDIAGDWQELTNPLQAGPRLVFASSKGTLFVCMDQHPMWRSTDGGQNWAVCLDSPVWRMDEDDQGNLYAGNYIKDGQHIATLYKSSDNGETWNVVYENRTNDHIHTVRWDDYGKRLYISFGDGRGRGQAYSDDRGDTFVFITGGHGEGHTDVAVSTDYIFWGSDDSIGRIIRVDRNADETVTYANSPQNIWFVVADGQQVYAGTSTTGNPTPQRGVLLASHDQGQTWQKIIQTDLSAGSFDQGFYAESRVLSSAGWLYCTGSYNSYRIRRNPD